MRASAPGSSANLGPGFDVLAVAISLRAEVTVEPAGSLSISTAGEGAGLPQDASHLAARVAAFVAGHDRLAITVRSNIPMARGLGSSAALAVAAAAAAGAPDPLAVAASFDGHLENAAASTLGGLVAATDVAGRAVVRRLELDPGIGFVALVPDQPLSTSEARAVLPGTVPLADALFDLGRLPLLLTGLADRSLLDAVATEDRLHQPARTALFPEADGLMERLLAAGARAVCWSGAGSAILGICYREDVDAVRSAGDQALAAFGVRGYATILEADLAGLRVG